MRTDIPQGLRVTYLINFIFALIFGLGGVFAATLVGNIAQHPVKDYDVNALMGVAALTFAYGSWFGYRAVRWEQISLVTAMLAFFNLLGGIGGLIAYFVPGVIGSPQPLPAVQLLVSVILLLLGLSFTYFYTSMNGWRAPLVEK